MKKALVLLLLVAMVAPVFADDAKVLPQGVARIRIIPVLATTAGSYDDSGDLTDNKDGAGDRMPDKGIWALGGALEYGITNQISMGLRWTPVYQFMADADVTGSDDFDVQTGGLEHADLGAEIQIIGEQGYVSNDLMRFSVTPGVAIPMPVTTDWAAEGKNVVSQSDFILPTSLNTTEAQLGLLLNFDYVIDDTFEVNLFTEGRYRFARTRDVKDFYNGLVEEAASLSDAYSTYDIEFGPSILWEAGIEPKASFPLSDVLRLDAGLTTKFTLQTAQDRTTTVALSSPTATETVGGVLDAQPTLEGFGLQSSDSESTTDGDTAYILRFEPSIGAFITALPLPLEVTAQYSIPLLGQNEVASRRLITQLRAYVRF
jgi:hypothetical protein